MSPALHRVRKLLQPEAWLRPGPVFDRSMVLFGAAVGALAALATVGFAKAVHWAESESASFQASHVVWVLPVLPVLGATITGLLVHFLARDAGGHGVSQVLDALIRRGGVIRARVGLVKIIASISTVGSGGSAGMEGPIVQIGSTLGSVVGSTLKFSRQHLATMVGCGAAAGIASIFNAPITGVFFVLEVLLRDFSLRVFTPVVIAAVISTATTQALLRKDESIFAFGLEGYHFSLAEVPTYVLLGMLCAVTSIVFTRLLYKGEALYERWPIHPVLKPVSGAILLGVLGIIFVLATGSGAAAPPFFGNGYDTIRTLLDPASYTGQAGGGAVVTRLFGALVLLTIFKMIGTVCTLASGGSGGVFAPSLFIGATGGAALGVALERLGLMPVGGSPASYALVGMSGLIAGTTFAPLTAILLVFELTREPPILLPAMLVGTIAASLGRYWMRDSIYTLALRQRGLVVGTARDHSVLRRIPVTSVPVTPLPPEPVYASDPLSKLVALHAFHDTPDFVVVDPEGSLLGLVTGSDMRTALIDREAIPLLLVAELMRTDLPAISPDEHLDTVLDKFADHDVASLPLMDGFDRRRPAGLITRTAVMREYNRALEES